MSKSTGLQFAAVEQPFGCEPPIVHCPICGQATVEVGDEGGRVTPCRHLAFIFVGEADDFEYQSEDFSARMASIDEEEFGGIEERLCAAGFANDLLALSITYGGMASGPVWFTDIFGFDYSKVASEAS